jgi:MFS-type transporter involved in bile tolerance (Atg22 family)
MNILNCIALLADTSQYSAQTLVPFGTSFHLAFCVIAVVFFVLRFAKQRKPFQLIFAVAVAATSLLQISSDRSFFYIVGLFELFCMIAAIVSTIIYNSKHKETKNEKDNDTSVSEENNQK